MVDKEPDEELRQRWWLRMRRCYGVPDLVKDGHARTAVVRTSTDSTTSPHWSTFDPS